MGRRAKWWIEPVPAEVALAVPDAFPAGDEARVGDARPIVEATSKEARDASLVAANIRRMLQFRRTTVERVARRLGVEPEVLRSAVDGVRLIPIDLLWRIARALSVPFGTLVQPSPVLPREGGCRVACVSVKMK